MIGPSDARLPLQTGGWVAIERDPLVARFHLDAEPPAGDLVHPYLAPAAAVAARWAGRESFHAGAVIIDGGAWAILGEKESGKSSTLARLALDGHAVLTDDLLVLDGADALAGPCCVDLRREPAERLGVGEPLGVVGMRERWRLALDPSSERAPLRGWVTLDWHDEVAVERLTGPMRLLALLPLRAVRIEPGAPQHLIDLATLPVLRLRRPRRWSSLRRAVDHLVQALGA